MPVMLRRFGSRGVIKIAEEYSAAVDLFTF